MLIKLQLDEWVSKFKPLNNDKLDPSDKDLAGIMIGDILPEYTPSQLHLIKKVSNQSPFRIWSIVVRNGSNYILSGMRPDVATSYIVTEEPFEPNNDYEVIEYESDQTKYSRLLSEGKLSTIYQIKPEFRDEDMDDNEVFVNLDFGKGFYPEIPDNGWQEIDCSNGCQIINPQFLA